MKQIINSPGCSIEINEHEGVIITTVSPAEKSEGMTFGEFSRLKSKLKADISKLNIKPVFDRSEYGVYITLKNGLYFNPEFLESRFNREEAIGVLLKTKHASIIISKEDLPEMKWDEAIKHNPFDRHEAIEIHKNKDQINKALDLIGGQPIKEGWYWTRDEYSTNYAWLYSGTNGTLTFNGMNYSLSVRPVTAF